MNIVAVIGQKGGPGKTTVAENLAVEAATRGERVVLLDLDPQASAAKWSDRRTTDNVEVQSVQAARLPQVLKVAQQEGATLAILDTPGRAADLAIAAARAATLVVIPFRPAIKDVETMPAVLDLLTTAGSPRAFAVVNAAPNQGSRHIEAQAVMESYGFSIAPVVMYQRNVYFDAPAAGMAVTEYEPNGKAALEVRELYTFVAAQLAR
jgi:chromosome partitioning protein